ncbi:MAG TPA: tRNA (adenosine(37)-N6)-dimethylallyltransferase MiaA [Acidobacteriaceae bacterium]
MVSLLQPDPALIVVCGPTASGKTSLALALAERFAGEIVSCDSVAVYRGMEIGTAKPTFDERARIPHHLIDILTPDQPCTAGEYSRLAREAIRGISERQRLPIVCGGTGLYLRALLDGLFPAPQRHEPLRKKLRQRAEEKGPAHLHRILTRLDPAAARLIHANDAPKVIRAIEVTLSARRPITQQWEEGREPLTGFRVLRLGLNPPRAALYARINQRAAEMFERGLVEETTRLVERYGFDCRPLTSLGYAQAVAVLRNEMTRDEAVKDAQQGHRNYAKRQLTWFRKDSAIHWIPAFGSDEDIAQQACDLVARHLEAQ